MNQLNDANLSQISDDVVKPKYDRSQVSPGIVHIGPSAFFRGHLAVYADDLLNKGHKDCGIIAVSLRSSTYRDQLVDQDYLYTVHERNSKQSNTRIIGSLKDILIAPHNPKRVVDLMASPETKVITLTVTQDGYHFSPDGGLNFDAPDIKHSLNNADDPKAAVAFIVAALEKRMAQGLPGLTVMSCDNVNGNGDKLRQTVQAYAGMKSKDLRHWIDANVRFPNTMVDRIVPKWDASHTQQVADKHGYQDKLPVFTEPFRQLVIDRASDGSFPPLNEVGAKYVPEVAPFELAKIRLLNGGHMALGIMGRLGGFNLADEAVSNPGMRTFMEGYMKEVSATLNNPEFDVPEYIEGLFARLENPHMKDELQRLARNGLSKVDSRFLGPLRDAYAQDLPRDHLVDAVAGWIEYMQKSNDDPNQQDGFNIEDKAAYTKGIVQLAKSLNGDVTPIFALDIWDSLGDNPTFRKELQEAYTARRGGPDYGNGGPAAPGNYPGIGGFNKN